MVPEALRWLEQLGGITALQKHAREVLDVGVGLLVERLGWARLDLEEEMTAPYMRCVRIPWEPPRSDCVA